MDPTQELRLEDERAFLDTMVQTAGWKVFYAKWSRLLKECELKLRSPENPNREWDAGLVTGYLRILSYPGDRINKIDKQLLEASKPNK